MMIHQSHRDKKCHVCFAFLVFFIQRCNFIELSCFTEKNCGWCLPKWIFHKRSCYYFSDEDVSSRKNWTDSRDYCISKGGDLLVINNVEEQVGEKKGKWYWRMGQPSRFGPQTGNCVAFLGETISTWYNADCSQHRLNWICEKEARKTDAV
uniref:C-type lectin domain-containing protein n=1 Tax=Oryzias sinensis TaxID=183150 RepID=A0A8C7YE79_9TELE